MDDSIYGEVQMVEMPNNINSDEDYKGVYKSVIPENIKPHEADCMQSNVNNIFLKTKDQSFV